MYCIHCGERLVESAKFCAACGEKIQRPQDEEQRPERSVSVPPISETSETSGELITDAVPVVEPPTGSPLPPGVPLTVNAPNLPDTTTVAKTGSSLLRKVGKVVISLVGLVLAIAFGTSISAVMFPPGGFLTTALNMALLTPWVAAVWHPRALSASVWRRALAVLLGSITGTVVWLLACMLGLSIDGPVAPFSSLLVGGIATGAMFVSGGTALLLCRIDSLPRRHADRVR